MGRKPSFGIDRIWPTAACRQYALRWSVECKRLVSAHAIHWSVAMQKDGRVKFNYQRCAVHRRSGGVRRTEIALTSFFQRAE